MKKLILLLLVIFTMGTFALDVNMNVQGSVGFNLDVNDATKTDQNFAFGDVRPSFIIKKGETTVYWMPKMSTTLADYFFVDTMTGVGMLRVGLQRLGLANFVAGPYATSTFLVASVQKGNGVALMTKLAGMMVKVSLLGNMWLLDDGTVGTMKSSLAVLVDTGMPFGLKVGGVYSNDNTKGATKSGLSAYAEGKQDLAGLTVAGAAFFDLSDDAALSDICAVTYTGATKARRLVQAYVAYPLGAVELRGSYTTDLNKSGSLTTAIDNEIIGAVKYAISPEVNAWFTYKMMKNTAGTESKAGTVSFEFLVI